MPGLVDFAIGLMNSALNLPNKQLIFFFFFFFFLLGGGGVGQGRDSNYRTVVNPQC